MIKLKGSCHCQKIQFTVESDSPTPYLKCYCSVCRKVGGGGGYAINLGAEMKSLQITGDEHIRRYHKVDQEGKTEAPGARAFCSHCGSALWNYDPRWPEFVHPFASAIDSPLPNAPEISHMMLNYKPDWVQLDAASDDKCYDEYPDESLSEWHERHGLR